MIANQAKMPYLGQNMWCGDLLIISRGFPIKYHEIFE